jgi:hypothetical protein
VTASGEGVVRRPPADVPASAEGAKQVTLGRRSLSLLTTPSPAAFVPPLLTTTVTCVLLGVTAIASGCGDAGPSKEERIERVEKRYEQLWNAESVKCREAQGGGYDCTIWSKQKRPGDPKSGYDIEVPAPDSGP